MFKWIRNPALLSRKILLLIDPLEVGSLKSCFGSKSHPLALYKVNLACGRSEVN